LEKLATPVSATSTDGALPMAYVLLRTWVSVREHVASEQREGYAKVENTAMRITKGHRVALGYGKYFRSDSIVGLEHIRRPVPSMQPRRKI
jgi:hypothetical protein